MTAQLETLAAEVLQAAERAGAPLAAAESCTGGYIAALLTGVEGYSHMFETGFVTYSDKAKTNVLGIPKAAIESHGAVSKEVALAMATAALVRSRSYVAVAVSGFTGGAGPGDENGLVHIAAVDRAGRRFHRECHFGEVSRDEGRERAAATALDLLKDAILAGSTLAAAAG